MRGLSGKNVIVTGGGGAIGGAICKRFAAYGCKVGVFDKNRDGANKIAGEITEAGGKAFVSSVDIADCVVPATKATCGRSAGRCDEIADIAVREYVASMPVFGLWNA